MRLKWPVMLLASVYYSWTHQFYLALLTAATPLVPRLLVRLVPHPDFVPMQRKMMQEIGFDPDQEDLNRNIDHLKAVMRSVLS